jgi:hypothetical protein
MATRGSLGLIEKRFTESQTHELLDASAPIAAFPWLLVPLRHKPWRNSQQRNEYSASDFVMASNLVFLSV